MTPDRKNLYQNIARAGFAARGVTYCLVGGLAFAAAIGSGGQTTGSTGALRTLADSTWGTVLLVLIGVGLFGYGMWRCLSAALDLENQGGGAKGKARRIGHFFSGLFHFVLAVYAFMLAFGLTGGGGGNRAQSLTARIMEWPGGRWIVLALGVIGVIVALEQADKAIRERYRKRTRIPEKGGWVNRGIKIGVLSRAVVFGIVGGFLVYAGLTANPDQARGVGGALDWLQSQAWGGILLAVVGLGLVAFGLFGFIQARYRIIPDPEDGASHSHRAYPA
ncbi:DUF1206 domain-containing protein [Parvularcula dongshanensis]|uniref:DUF1206 domain-containing protein n=1 Tax=Parvularcula dongshanensis TaxID=1173995 RepID=A0A840I5Z1_9PROT|nr:DUF1206 domain-containing protein [Parvularcula dongshanensis]MBB4659735.1 hypothetical protein [Parvularcula dongshanensis]